MKKPLLFLASATILAAAGCSDAPALAEHDAHGANDDGQPRTATPIKHLVVLFNENRSFDHYFATYPSAANTPGEPAFSAAGDTPRVNNLAEAHLLAGNPNFTNVANGSDAAEPFRLDRTQANTASQNHGYTAEQQAYHDGRADLFPKFTGRGTPGGVGAFGTRGQVMGYFDGNTVTAIWNYAQRFAMSDNAYTDTYGPSAVGALHVVSGQTDGALVFGGRSGVLADGRGSFTVIGDPGPHGDACSTTRAYPTQVTMTGRNIGNLLNDAGISWGSFMGGFDLSLANPNGTTGCARSTFSSVVGAARADYIPHHAWFQFYPSTSNLAHARPSSTEAIGRSLEADGHTPDPANHNYDLDDFYAAVKAGNFPAVSYVKLPAYQDGHAGYSDPLDEQEGTVRLINFLQRRPEWKDTAVILTYDDSDGWYDHAYAAPANASYDASADQLNGPGRCGTGVATQPQPAGVDGGPVNGRCGPGTRIPFLVISPYARLNYVSHVRISQASVVRFIEDNWLKGERLGGGSFDATAGSITDMFDFDRGAREDRLFLDPMAGTRTSGGPDEDRSH